MASLEMVSTQMFECVPRDPRNKKEKDLKVLVRDQFDIFGVFPADDSRSNQDGKSKEVLECSSRSSVSETEESLQTLSSPETNSNPFYNPVQPENPSRNGINMGASSLVQIWEARSQQSSPTHSQFLIDSRTSSGNWNNEELDWCLQSNMSYVSESCEKEREVRCLPPLVRIRGRQAFEDFLMMILSDRKKELKWIAGRYAVSKFSPRGCGRLQYMLRIRCFERCIAIRERHLLKPTKRSSKGSGVMNLSDRYKTNTGKVKLSEDTRKKNGLKKPEIERKDTEEGETMEKAIVMGSVETNNTSLSIAEKVNLWDSKERTYRRRTMKKAKNERKSARGGVDVETVEVNKEKNKKEEASGFDERKSMEIDDSRINPHEVTSVISLDNRKKDENASHVSREDIFSKDDAETSKAKKQEGSETLCQILESPTFLDGWDENDLEAEDEYEDYSGENVYYDWVSDISRPRSYWDNLRKQREIEVIKKYAKKDDIFQKLIKEKTVSSILAGDFREKIENVLISRPQRMLEVESNHEDEEASKEWLIESSARYQEELKENETEKVDLETVIVCDGFSQTSAKSTSLEDHEVSATISIDPKDQENTSSEIQMICDLREEIIKLRREMLELKGLVKSCVDFQKFKSVSDSVSDSLPRNCFVCFEKPIDSLLYRCGHMCTCLKCGHGLQWSTKKCPICMAPIIDVVRAFLDS